MDEIEYCDKIANILGIDEACLQIFSEASDAVNVLSLSEECDKCDYHGIATVPAYGIKPIVINTTYPLQLYLKRNNSTYCQQSFTFEEHGIYGLNITEQNCSDIYTIESPDLFYIPLIIAVCSYIALLLLWNILKCIYHSEWVTQIRERNVPFSELESDLGSPSSPEGPPLVIPEIMPVIIKKGRVRSLDVFRGICILIMIFVNYGGGKYWFFKHSPWNGLTVADLVFPWFLWIMGASIAISLRSQLRSCLSRKRLFLRVLQRSIILIALGVILNTSGTKLTSFENLRFPGVLQRIGMSYFVVASIETAFMKPQGSFQYGRWLIIQDILDSWIQWFVIFALTATQVLLTLMLPVPGCPTGYLGPGGWQNYSSNPNCTGGAAGYIDRLIFGQNHIYQRPTCQSVYNTMVPYDPEGILGTLTSVLNVYLGVQAGRIILSYHYTFSRITRWMVWAILMGIIAGVLCNFSKNDGIIPVNKNLWSLSFVLALASMAFIMQTVLYIVVDAKRWWSGSPFFYAGMNSIVLYIGHEVTKHMFPWSWRPYKQTHEEYLAMNLWGATLWMFIAYILYKKNIVITV
ncbi:hypothetical protein L9F63_015593 [Diploptera punctata]|uniref:Heparan-alpha-glucosaminide N-acetyltransferase n=1 Tax=Diploptera punctata TaxID=6984 RepID=A0AAD8A5X6_DIPPU|nr:hypothetical protein L9F63_015593 [Diploptera punctata]